MKTLLERAKPQLLEALAKQKTEYPGIANHVEAHLKNRFFANQIEFGTWMDLKSLWMQGTGVLTESPWDLFQED
jgi:hypothetical protein